MSGSGAFPTYAAHPTWHANPMQVTKLGSLRSAAGLIGDQVQATRTMFGPMRTLLSRGGIEVPANASASNARPIEL